MAINYTKNVTVDGTGDLILEFDIEELDSAIISPDVAIYLGFTDLSQAVFPIPAGSAFTISHDDFKNQTIEKIYALINKYLFNKPSNLTPSQKVVRIYAKSSAASSVISIAVLGGNK